MGLLTFSEMQSQVRTMLGGRTNQDALIMRGLQFAQWKISRVFAHEEMITSDSTIVSTTGTGNELTDSTITMPSTMRTLYSLSVVDDTNVTPLVGLTKEEWTKTISDVSSFDRGKPSRFVRFMRTIYLWRPPDDDYTIQRLYSNWPTEITLNDDKDAPASSSTTSDLDHKDDIIIVAAAVWCYISINNRERANQLFAILKNMLNEAGVFDSDQPSTPTAAVKTVDTFVDYTVPTFSGWR